MIEATWGADPLEAIGGFRGLHYDSEAQYPSSLGLGGRVSWSSHQLECSSLERNVTEAALTVGFPNVDWPFLQSVHGWAALQYQAWTRGYMAINSGSSQSVVLYTDSVLEFWVDDVHYFGGDFYAYRNAPLVLHLKPGSHRLDIRLVRDVRAMGGTGDPRVSIKLKAEGSNVGLAIMAEKIVVSDVVNKTLASPLASITVRNDGRESIEILGVASPSVCPFTYQGIGPLLMEVKGNRFHCHARKVTLEADTGPVETFAISHLCK